MEKISYAIGKDYISDWGINEALREIFQNYIDYGDYHVDINMVNDDVVIVCITNDYKPDNLEFLRLGGTDKKDTGKIGHHGEGLKAAFLIFGREDLYFALTARGRRFLPGFENTVIGETLYISYTDVLEYADKDFTTIFHCPKQLYLDFVNNIVKDDDILYSHPYYGDLLRDTKGKGNIYCGKLFVSSVKGLDYSYNIKPEKLKLDRDRRTPKDFDLDYACSQILEGYQRTEDITTNYKPINYNSREYQFSGHVSESDLARIDAISVKGNMEFYDKANKVIISNTRVKETLLNHEKFAKVRKVSYADKFNARKAQVAKRQTTTLLSDFKKNYCYNDTDMSIDIDIITQRIKTDNIANKLKRK